VVERCPAARPCAGCEIESDCQGRAKHADGFVRVDDLIAQHWRTSDTTWAAEMMCRGPSTAKAVYTLDAEKHIGNVSVGGGESELVAGIRFEKRVLDSGPELSLNQLPLPEEDECVWLAGMDFGINSPFVMLWARVLGKASDSPLDRPIEIVDEYLEHGMTLDANLRRVKLRGWPTPEWVGCDNAGRARNSHSGVTDLDLVRRAGFRVRSMACTVTPGIERIRRRLDRGLLKIDARCVALIKGMSEYHFADDRNDARPVKDGPDHVCDALRYLVVNLEMGARVERVKRY
jgi:hypothetical protein